MKFNGATLDVRLVCFDWNGTLLDDWALAYAAVQAIFSDYGLPSPSEDDYRRGISADYMEFYLRHSIPRPSAEEGMVALKADLNRIRTNFLNQHWESTKLSRGVEDLLRFLSDGQIITTIVSAEQPDVLQKRLVWFQIRSYFDRVTGGASSKDGKLNALRDHATCFEIAPEECIYVDDTFDGLMSAKLAGFRTVAILNGYNSAEAIIKAKPDFSAPSFERVKNAFL